jgi:hypothetical protein
MKMVKNVAGEEEDGEEGEMRRYAGISAAAAVVCV